VGFRRQIHLDEHHERKRCRLANRIQQQVTNRRLNLGEVEWLFPHPLSCLRLNRKLSARRGVGGDEFRMLLSSHPFRRQTPFVSQLARMWRRRTAHIATHAFDTLIFCPQQRKSITVRSGGSGP
jgi:hypothetical protein